MNLPLLRWKRFALVAAMCILAVRAVIVQIAFFLHIQYTPFVLFGYRLPNKIKIFEYQLLNKNPIV
ncbi:hypothetical protein CsSME_00015165 [Camellia sinensis var. sinensis]